MQTTCSRQISGVFVCLVACLVFFAARGVRAWPVNADLGSARSLDSSSTSEPTSTEASFVITTPILVSVEEEVDEENPRRTPTVRSLKINSTIRYRYSVTECVSRVLNPDASASEATFTLTLPESAFISNFSIEVKGKVYHAKIEEKQAAKDIYNAAVSAGQTAGHVALNPRDSSRFSVSVNVAAKEKITFRLVYEELLLRRVGQYEQKINLDPGQLVPELIVEATIEETKNFTKVRVPELRKGLLETEERDNPLATISYLAGNQVKITYAPKLADQKRLRDNEKGISGEFIIQYDINHDPKGELYVADGYFVHFLAADAKQFAPMRKHVVFVIDLSGSMYGDKLQQTKDAMKVILKEMNSKDDYVSIVTFSSGAKVWQPTPSETAINVTVDTDPLAPQKATEDLLKRATVFVDSWEADGYTDIDSALKLGFAQARKAVPEAANDIQPVAPIVVFLTDGVPTQGELNEEKIVSNTVKRNAEADNKIHLFTLGFGRDVSFAFLKKVGLRNGGFSRKIYADSDATLQLTGFFEEISHPVLMDVNITYLGDAVDKNATARSLYKTAFDGSEMITAGRLSSPSGTISEYLIEAISRTGPVAFNGSDPTPIKKIEKDAGNAYTNFLERLWAYQSVRHYLDRLDAGFETDNATELKQKALDICLQYSFVTDLTSLVVVKPEKDSQVVNEKEEVADLQTADVNQVVSSSLATGVANKAQSFGPPGPSSLQQLSLSSGYSARPGFQPYSASAGPPGPAVYPSTFGGHHYQRPGIFPVSDPHVTHVLRTTTRRPHFPATYATSRRPTSSVEPPSFHEEDTASLDVGRDDSTTTIIPDSLTIDDGTTTIDSDGVTQGTNEGGPSQCADCGMLDVLSNMWRHWVTEWVSAMPGSRQIVSIGKQEFLAYNSSYFALNATNELSAECQVKGTNSSGICSTVSTCAVVWNDCDIGSDPIGTMVTQFKCDTGSTKPGSDEKIFGICCPPPAAISSPCPSVQLR